MSEIQLLPGTKKRLGIKVPGENRFLYIGSAILGAAIVVSFSFSQYNASLTKQIENLNAEILAIEQRRDRQGEQGLATIEKQIRTTGDLIKKHIYWSQGLTKIASLIQSQVWLDSLSYSGGNEVSLKAFAPSYSILARQLAALSYEEIVKDVTLGNMSPSPEGVIEFRLSIILDEAALLKKEAQKTSQ